MFNLIKRMIVQKNYDSKEDIINKINAFSTATPPMLSKDEQQSLLELLNPIEFTLIENTTKEEQSTLKKLSSRIFNK